MAAAGQDTRGRTSSDFVDDTVLEAFVPAASQVNVQELLEAWDGEVLEDKNTIVPFIEQRPFLLLDEEVPVHIVLRTKLLDEDVLEAYLARMAISLEARAYGTLHVRPEDQQKPAAANELLYSGAIDPDEEPTICATEVQPEGHDEPIQYVYIFWKLTVPISRPKAKINKLSIYFTPSASLKPIEANPKAQTLIEDEYLMPGVPQPPNLLAPFANDPALRGVKPKLLVSSLYRAPTTTVRDMPRSLRTGSRRLFRAAPAFLWRLRFIPSPAPAEQRATIAALDLEITPFASSPVRLEDVTLNLAAGRVEVLTPLLPKDCQPGDQLTLLYKLWPGNKEEVAALGGALPDLKVTAAGTVLISETCMPRIRFSILTPVDLPSPSRPTSRAAPLAAAITGAKDAVPKPIGPDTLLSMASPPPQSASPAGASSGATFTTGILISITGPPTITVNQPFIWSLFIINRSEKVHRLALVAIPRRRAWSKHGQKDSVTSMRGGHTDARGNGTRSSNELAEAVVDGRAVYAAQRSGTQEPTGLLCLSPDVRVGPLAPGACFTTEIKFVALTPGVQNLEALRLVDLSTQTQDAIDVRYLPDIIVNDDANSDSGSEE